MKIKPFLKRYFLHTSALLMPFVAIVMIYRGKLPRDGFQVDQVVVYFYTCFLFGLFLAFPSCKRFITGKVMPPKRAVFCLFLFPVFLNFISGIVAEFYRLSPALAGRGDIIPIGSGQVVSNLPPFSFDRFLFNCLLPALNEELRLKYFPFCAIILICKGFFSWRDIPLFAKMLPAVRYLFNKLRSHELNIVNLVFAVGVSALFSLIHGVTWQNFFIYFFLGLINTLLLLKYGLAAAVIGHASFNYLSILHWYVANNIIGLIK